MNKIICGDALSELKKIQSESAQMCVTSPPYWGLRNYFNPKQLGLQSTEKEYLDSLVDVFKEVFRVLKKDGTFWLNISDSYTSKNRSKYDIDPKQPARSKALRPPMPPDLKEKELVGIPWKLAFEVRKIGYYLRSEIIWAKPNPMPESVADRPTKSHEQLFLFSKSKNYFYDYQAIKEPAANDQHSLTRKYRVKPSHKSTPTKLTNGIRSARDSFKRINSKRIVGIPGQTVGTHRPNRKESLWDTATKNKRDVWTIPTKPYRGAHAATFPEALIEPCIKAGSHPNDIVLDPFFGAGTTGVVAKKLGRHYLGIELNPEYCSLAKNRIESV